MESFGRCSALPATGIQARQGRDPVLRGSVRSTRAGPRRGVAHPPEAVVEKRTEPRWRPRTVREQSEYRWGRRLAAGTAQARECGRRVTTAPGSDRQD